MSTPYLHEVQRRERAERDLRSARRALEVIASAEPIPSMFGPIMSTAPIIIARSTLQQMDVEDSNEACPADVS